MLVVEPDLYGLRSGGQSRRSSLEAALRVALKNISRNDHAYDVGHSGWGATVLSVKHRADG
jgi:hypothetical protein